jgi:L-serine kinase (ADP)
MTDGARFALVPISVLRPHERVDLAKAEELVEEIRRTGMVADPVWVARDGQVILNGHHRVEALRRLGARKVPALLVDYSDEAVTLDRWSPGPPISKKDVLEHARRGELFPPKTTRHGFRGAVPSHPTPLSALLPRAHGAARKGTSAQPEAPRLPRGSARSPGGGT